MTVFQRPKRLFSGQDSTPTFGHFYALPFERGFGTTIGNAMRRILLSSIEGAAITAVKIEGILHEFSSIPGIREDATDIIMNLKSIPIRLHVDHPKTIYLESTGAGDLKSANVKPDPDVEILDPDIFIATVNDTANLKIEARVRPGRGYVRADENFEEDLDIEYIPVDSIHSPVKKVDFDVEAARLGQLTDYDQLNLNVWTNGCVTPQDAVAQAAKILKDHLYIFINYEQEPEVPEPEVEDEELDGINDNLNKSVEELELSVRSYNCLKNANIQTLGELVTRSESEMLKTKNFGRKSLNEIREILVGMGLSFAMKLGDRGTPVKEEVEA
ncbi:MAG: DNA-directed RNA polymerase subunit alpha [Acidobacteriota bacterium]